MHPFGIPSTSHWTAAAIIAKCSRMKTYLHRQEAEHLDQVDALLFGWVTFEMMEAAWRRLARTGARP
jgi:hypothetical protein